jgi:hypothetical protein
MLMGSAPRLGLKPPLLQMSCLLDQQLQCFRAAALRLLPLLEQAVDKAHEGKAIK